MNAAFSSTSSARNASRTACLLPGDAASHLHRLIPMRKSRSRTRPSPSSLSLNVLDLPSIFSRASGFKPNHGPRSAWLSSPTHSLMYGTVASSTSYASYSARPNPVLTTAFSLPGEGHTRSGYRNMAVSCRRLGALQVPRRPAGYPPRGAVPTALKKSITSPSPGCALRSGRNFRRRPQRAHLGAFAVLWVGVLGASTAEAETPGVNASSRFTEESDASSSSAVHCRQPRTTPCTRRGRPPCPPR